jgi:hypothetical protein
MASWIGLIKGNGFTWATGKSKQRLPPMSVHYANEIRSYGRRVVRGLIKAKALISIPAVQDIPDKYWTQVLFLPGR